MLILQINLNHHWAAQNLLAQNMAEFGFDLACVSEPASIPRSPHWFASANGSAAIVANPRDPTLRCVPIKSGRNFIVLKCNQYHVFSVYIAPSEDNVSFYVILDEMGTAIRAIGDRCIITGDFKGLYQCETSKKIEIFFFVLFDSLYF